MTRWAVIFIILSSWICGQATEIPVNTPSSENFFTAARELYGRGDLEYLEYADPVSDSLLNSREAGLTVRDIYLNLKPGYESRGKYPRITGSLETVESFRYKDKSENYIKLFPYSRLDIRPGLSATIVYRIDRELSRDRSYEGKSWNGWAGFAENATVDLKLEKMKFRFGLERLSWGLGRYGNLMFSRQGMPMAVLGFSYRRGKFDFESISGFLSSIPSQVIVQNGTDEDYLDIQRYVTAHSLTYKPIPRLSLSIREAVIYGGIGRRFEPAYAFPLIWYHGYQLNSGLDDNTLVSIGFDYRGRGRFWVYGELLVDDYQIEKKNRSDYEPDQTGLLLGGEFYDLGLAGSIFSMEYVRIANWTYNQINARNRFTHRNFPLGFPDGPDTDVLNWEYSWWITGKIKLAYFGHYKRKGEGAIDSPWTAPWLDADNYAEPFPTGTVRRELANGISLLFLNKNNLWGKLTAQTADINNDWHSIGLSKSSKEIYFDLGYQLPPIGWGL